MVRGTKVSDVSMIGLGAMGSALARAFVGAGHRITVWNRTRRKMRPLVDAGASGAANLIDAIEASPIIVVCIGAIMILGTNVSTVFDAMASSL